MTSTIRYDIYRVKSETILETLDTHQIEGKYGIGEENLVYDLEENGMCEFLDDDGDALIAVEHGDKSPFDLS